MHDYYIIIYATRHAKADQDSVDLILNETIKFPNILSTIPFEIPCYTRNKYIFLIPVHTTHILQP